MKIYLKIRRKKRNGFGPWTFLHKKKHHESSEIFQVIQSLISSSFAKKFQKDPTPLATPKKTTWTLHVHPPNVYHRNREPWKSLLKNPIIVKMSIFQLWENTTECSQDLRNQKHPRCLRVADSTSSFPSKLSPSRRQNSCEAIRKRVERSLEVKWSKSIRVAVGVFFFNPLSALMGRCRGSCQEWQGTKMSYSYWKRRVWWRSWHPFFEYQVVSFKRKSTDAILKSHPLDHQLG